MKIAPSKTRKINLPESKMRKVDPEMVRKALGAEEMGLRKASEIGRGYEFHASVCGDRKVIKLENSDLTKFILEDRLQLLKSVRELAANKGRVIVFPSEAYDLAISTLEEQIKKERDECE